MAKKKPKIEIVEGPQNETQRTVEEFKKKVFEAADWRLQWVTVPLVHFDNDTGKAREIRTGILIEIGDAKFLVTAGHGLIEHEDEGRPLCAILPDKAEPPVPLVFEKFMRTVDDREDVAVCQLKAPTLARFEGHFRYLRISDMYSRKTARSRPGLFLLYGYPRAMIQEDPEGGKRTDTWKYLTTEYEGSTEEVKNYDPVVHLILDYEKDAKGRDGKVVQPPGLSGCGVYHCGLPVTHPLFDENDLKLVGIQTAWRKDLEYAKATWIDIVLLIIWKYFPDVRGVMRFHGIDHGDELHTPLPIANP